jgi:hypothetical protein
MTATAWMAAGLIWVAGINFTCWRMRHTNPRCGRFCVADLATARAALTAAGAPIREFIPSDGRERFFSADPFGNRLEFMAGRTA